MDAIAFGSTLRPFQSSRNTVEKGANKEGCNIGTPLNVAAHSGHFEVVKILLEQGANRNVGSTVRPL